MDPIGVITNLFDLFTIIQTLDGLRQKYKNAPAEVEALLQECAVTESMLGAVKTELTRSPDSLTRSSAGQTLVICFNSSTAGITGMLEELEKEVTAVRGGKKNRFGMWEKTKFVWKDEYFKDCLQVIRDQRDLVQFVLNSIQLHAINGIHEGIQKIQDLLAANQGLGAKSTPNVPQLKPQQPKLTHAKSDNQIKKSGSKLAKELLAAVKSGKAVDVERVLLDGASPDVSLGDSGDRAIHIAAREGYLPIVDRLLAHGADANVRNKSMDTPLHQALNRGQVATSLTLLSNGASFTSKDHDGRVALHIAAKRASYLLTQCLLDRGADANVRDNFGTTPLLRASNPTNREGKGIKLDLRIIRLLLEHGADPTIGTFATSKTPLHELAGNGNAKELDVVAKAAKSVDPRFNEKGRGATPLYSAVLNGHDEAVAVLIKHHADVNARRTSDGDGAPTALWPAIQHDKLDIATKLLEAGAKPNVTNKEGETLLHWAAKKGSAKPMKLLVRYKADVNAQLKSKDTPLHLVAWQKNAALTRLLLDNGAHVDALGQYNSTPFMCAAQAGSLPVMRLLLSRGAQWQYTTPQGTNAFIWACYTGEIVCASFLLGLGNNIDKKSYCDYTALHYAAARRRLECVRWLLELGADRRIKATKERHPFKGVGTAAELARAHGHEDVAELIDGWASDTE